MDREKLIETIRLAIARVLDIRVDKRELELIADYLIANGIGDIADLKAENEALRKQLETITFPMKLQYGDLTNYIGYGQSETEKLFAIAFGVLKEKGSYFSEEKEGEKPLFIAYFDRIESLEVLENLVNIGKARLAELEDSDGTQNN